MKDQLENSSSKQIAEILVIGLDLIKSRVKKVDNYLYERWKAGGFLIDDNVVSMYPNVLEVVQSINDDDDDDEDDDEDYGGFIGGLGSN